MLAPNWRVAFFIAGGLFLLSFVLPAFGGDERGRAILGIEAAFWALIFLAGGTARMIWEGEKFFASSFAWPSLSVLANPLFMSCWLTVLIGVRRRANRGMLGWLAITTSGLAFILTFGALIVDGKVSARSLTIGYYLWSLSIGLLPLTLIFGFRPYVGTAAPGPAAGGKG